ncbi:MAG: Uma2 family endonuclease [Thermoguttaceae bacterium]|jgi:Uma2 family endonuclease
MSVATPQAESRVLLSNVAWSTFEALLAENECRGTRFAFDRGFLEIMSPSVEHERIKTLLGRMIEFMVVELNIPISSGGSTTLKDEMKQRGLEPDECYFVANEPRMRGRDDYDAAVDPPPDLAIEVGISRSALNKLAIYADFAVPEVWIHDGTALRVYHLQPEGGYVQQDHSRSFPFLPLDEVHRFLGRRNATDETTWIRSFRDWVRRLDTKRQ